MDAMLALFDLDRVRLGENDPPLVLVFNAERARFPGGVFSSLESVEGLDIEPRTDRAAVVMTVKH